MAMAMDVAMVLRRTHRQFTSHQLLLLVLLPNDHSHLCNLLRRRLIFLHALLIFCLQIRNVVQIAQLKASNAMNSMKCEGRIFLIFFYSLTPTHLLCLFYIILHFQRPCLFFQLDFPAPTHSQAVHPLLPLCTILVSLNLNLLNISLHSVERLLHNVLVRLVVLNVAQRLPQLLLVAPPQRRPRLSAQLVLQFVVFELQVAQGGLQAPYSVFGLLAFGLAGPQSFFQLVFVLLLDEQLLLFLVFVLLFVVVDLEL